MTRERIGQVVFLGAVTLSLVIYYLTAPEGLPWNESTHWAVGYLGGGFIETALPAGNGLLSAPAAVLPHPIWGRFVEVFGGNVALSCVLAAFGAGLLGAIVNRYLGWRAAASAAIVWIFSVWDGAITGERSVCLWTMAVAAAWVVNAAGLRMTRKARAARRSAPTSIGSVGGGALGDRALPGVAHEVYEKRAKINRIVSWVLLGVAGMFAIVAASLHDYKLGEAASVFARGVVEEAGERIIAANGLVDDQIAREVGIRNEELGMKDKSTIRYSSFIVLRSNDEDYRRGFVAWVRQKWPAETNLWVAAEVSPTAFLQVAVRRWPERFYLMNGASTTEEAWEKRWTAFQPYLKSSDPFVAAAKLAFAHEGEALAKRLELAGNWQGLKRLREKLPQVEKKDRKRVISQVAQGRKKDIASEILSLVEWNNEMVAAMERGDSGTAGRIARAILSNPAWSGYLPANAVMGTVASKEGDYLASAEFFRVAVSTTNAVPLVVLNDYADTLMRLGRLEAAEAMARRAVEASSEDFWLARLTLAEVLQAKHDRQELVEVKKEIAALIESVIRHAPKSVGKKVRRKFGRAW